MSTATEPAILPPFSPTTAATNRRSYRCYNCNYSFHITPTAAAAALSPSSFRCPRCHHRHLLPHHVISPPPPPPPPPPSPPPPPPLPMPLNSNYTRRSSIFTYYASDDSDSDYDYDSDGSILSFNSPNFHPSTPALRSFVNSLPIKVIPPNSTPSLQSCSICLEDFEINSNSSITVNELPCQHYFHKDCIVEWLKRTNTCPLCRFKLPIEPDPEEGPAAWGHEYDAALLLELAPRGERVLRRVTGVQSLIANAASDSDRRVMSVNGGIRSGSGFDAMHDDDGDTLMADA